MSIVGQAWIRVLADGSGLSGSMATQTKKAALEADAAAAKAGKAYDEQMAASLAGGKTPAAAKREAEKASAASLAVSRKAIAQAEADAEKSRQAAAKKFSGLGGGLLGGMGLTGGAIGLAVVADKTIHAAEDYQSVVAQLRANTGLTEVAAQSMGKAFLTSGNITTFSAKEQLAAYTAVSGQLQLLAGHALSNAQAMTVMKAAQDAAEASGSGLDSVTSALANTMQTYRTPLADASKNSDILFNVSRSLHVPIEAVAASVDKLHARLGTVAPTLAQTAIIMGEAKQAGLDGGRGMMMLSNAFTHLLATAAPAAKATGDAALKLEQAQLRVNSATVAQANALAKYGSGSTQYQLASEKLTIAQTSMADIQTKLSGPAMSKMQKALGGLNLQVYDAKGNFVGMRSVIAQLNPVLEKMSNAQRRATLETLFGRQAASVMQTIIMQGVAGYDKTAQAITTMGSAHTAAEIKQKTLTGQTKELKAQLSNLGTEVGTALIPELTTLATDTEKVVGWFEHHKQIAQDLAYAVGTVLVLAVGRYTAEVVGTTYKTLAKLAEIALGWVGVGTAARGAAAEEAAALGLGTKGIGAGLGTRLGAGAGAASVAEGAAGVGLGTAGAVVIGGMIAAAVTVAIGNKLAGDVQKGWFGEIRANLAAGGVREDKQLADLRAYHQQAVLAGFAGRGGQVWNSLPPDIQKMWNTFAPHLIAAVDQNVTKGSTNPRATDSRYSADVRGLVPYIGPGDNRDLPAKISRIPADLKAALATTLVPYLNTTNGLLTAVVAAVQALPGQMPHPPAVNGQFASPEFRWGP